MQTTTFSTQIRVLLCSHCGAPLEAPIAGGPLACRFCNVMNQAVRRDERPLPSAQHGPVPEDQRVMHLRSQDGKPLLPPPSLQGLVQNGSLAPWKVQEALSVWQSTRQELRTSASFEAAERILFLTMLLSNHFSEANDLLRQRAMFESALDVVTLPRHRQVLRGYLCRSAVRAGDLQAAEEWLRPCDARSDDLETDSAYRFSRAFLDTARRDYGAVLQTLGRTHEEVPTQDAVDVVCAVLRANAWEKLGHVPTAIQLLEQALAKYGASGRQVIGKVIELNAQFGLCAQSFSHAQQQHAVVAGRAAAAAASGGIHKVFVPIGILMLIASAVCIVVAILGLVIDMDGAAAGAGIALFTTIPIGVIFTAIGIVMKKAAEKAERLRVHGIPGNGRIVSAQGTGMKINGVPQVAFQLQIELPGRAPYPAVAKMLLPMGAMGSLGPGATVPVRVDPQDPSSVMIETT